MKKIFLNAAVAAFMFASCQNENIVEQNAQQEMQEFTVQVTKGVDSRVTMDGNEAVWSADDELYVYGKKNTYGTLKLVSGAGEATATFTGYINGSAANLENALFGAELKNGKITYTLNDVDVKELDFPMHGEFDDEKGTIELTNICGLVALNIEGLKSTDVVTLKGSGIAGEGTYKDGEWTAEGVATIEVKNAKDKTTFYVPVFASDEETTAVVTVGIKGGDTFGTSVAIKNSAISTGISNLKLDSNKLKDAAGKEGTDYVYTAEEFETANVENKTIELAADLDLNHKAITLAKGVTLNGNGNSITRSETSYQSGAAILCANENVTIKNLVFDDPNTRYDVYLFGGDVTIENCTFESSEDKKLKNAISLDKADGKVVIKNCTIDVYHGYAFGTNNVSTNTELLVEGGTMAGWMSYGAIESAKFEDVTFNAGEKYHFMNPYINTKFEDCVFNYPFAIGRGNGGLTHYMDDCTFNGYEADLSNFVQCDGDGKPTPGGELTLIIDKLTYYYEKVEVEE